MTGWEYPPLWPTEGEDPVCPAQGEGGDPLLGRQVGWGYTPSLKKTVRGQGGRQDLFGNLFFLKRRVALQVPVTFAPRTPT